MLWHRSPCAREGLVRQYYTAPDTTTTRGSTRGTARPSSRSPPPTPNSSRPCGSQIPRTFLTPKFGSSLSKEVSSGISVARLPKDSIKNVRSARDFSFLPSRPYKVSESDEDQKLIETRTALKSCCPLFFLPFKHSLKGSLTTAPPVPSSGPGSGYGSVHLSPLSRRNAGPADRRNQRARSFVPGTRPIGRHSRDALSGYLFQRLLWVFFSGAGRMGVEIRRLGVEVVCELGVELVLGDP